MRRNEVIKMKEMPYSEKYAKVMDTLKFEETHLYPFARKSLGNQGADDLKQMIQNVSQPIREDASFEEKYRTAYSNWVLSGCTSFRFLRTSLGDEGVERLIRADVDALKKKSAGIGLSILNIIRFFSPRTAFSMTAKNMVYQLQWLGAYEVSEMSKTTLVLNIPHCDILDYPNSEDVCLIGCQRIYPLWVAEQLKADMRFNHQGKSCQMTLTPIK
jgi:hypothetical protein